MSRRRCGRAEFAARLLPLALALASGCTAHHVVQGLVLKVDPASATIVVSHDAVPGFMDAMIMPFTAAKRSILADVRPGDRVELRVTARADRTGIDRIAILSAAPVDEGLRKSPAVPTLTPIGGDVPDFTLLDHHGREVSLSGFRGQVVAVSFIYTRCPLPDYCPRTIGSLRAVHDRFRDRAGTGLTLLTVTFDPKYDTPSVLETFARQRGVDVSGWHFLTGAMEDVARVCSRFGVDYWPEEGLITHSQVIAVIDRRGRLAAIVEGRAFTARQLGDLIETVMNGQAAGSMDPWRATLRLR
jgi:protein SCO1/2